MEINEPKENYQSGWIKLFRSFTKWEWYNDSKMVHLFIHLLLTANHNDKKWQGILVKRGQVLTGSLSLAFETGMSRQNIRTCLKKLQLTGEIMQKSTSKYSIITICNYDSYQINVIEPNQQLTSNQPSTNQQLTSNQPSTNHKQEYKELKNNKNIRIKEDSLNFNLLKQIWMEFYKNEKGLDYYFEAKDGDAIKKLEKKIIAAMTARKIIVTEDSLRLSWKTFLEKMPDWHKEKMTLTLINGEYNRIISQIKSGLNGQQTNKTADYIRSIMG